MGFLKSVGTTIIYIGLFLTVITFIPGLPPEAEFSEYSIKYPAEVTDRSKFRNALQGAEILFSGELKGAEYFASYQSDIYTGVHGGYVIKLEKNHIVPIVKFGKKCDGIWQEDKCGRPLGLKFNDKGDLYVVDTYYGIFKVDVKTRQYKNIVNTSVPIDGKVPKIPNALDIAKNGDLYWTHSSTDFQLYDGSYTFFANPSGRLIRYNAATKKNEVLLKNLAFGNGVLLSDDESFVLVLETLSSRIVKYNLKGPKAGQAEIFAEALPGLPDNVHSDDNGGFLVSLIVYADPQHPAISQSLIPHPYLRKMIDRFLYVMEAPFKLLQDIYPNTYAERLMHSIGSFESMMLLQPKTTSVILRMDRSGNILDILYSQDEKVHGISSAYIHGEYLWLGSPFNEYITRVPLKQAFPDLTQNKKSSPNVKQVKQNIETSVPVKKAQDSKINVKEPVKSTTVKPTVQESTRKPVTTSKPVSKAPTTTTTTTTTTMTTPKPTTEVPITQKPATTTSSTQKRSPPPTVKTTKDVPVTEKTTSAPTTKQLPKSTGQPTVRTTTPKPSAPSTLPPASKASTNKDNKDNPKSSNFNADTKSSNVKVERSDKVKKVTVDSKPDKSVKEEDRVNSEKRKSTEQTDSSNEK